ncbi:tRNA (adenosine(37)-N6)-threonylcarbamoyltransferase complex dimerization subunit type 1 TsaB [Actinomyces vulturis]|uniref:tRNA (adenosine(37)-N6)-threonylcarbamoyltransferase complex dimerization subunit type 1 TsaB n=1 Tax=Actinomyces vulturis TaxID=1857645 RepID=UPI0008336AB4|nr:tRNA (adenosine(37)-N6)-threonylcarbamoyltransferase complex dimerization subunit type 1 TsaB [Actinomyces vulturis]
MRILSIDSSLSCAVALCEADAPDTVTVIAEESTEDSRRHAESLAPLMAHVVEQCPFDDGTGRTARQAPGECDCIDGVVVATGPAPFTGLRAGLVTARTFARARGIDIWGVPSLDALAAHVGAAMEPADEPTRLMVLTDARRKEVYAAVYELTPGPACATTLSVISPVSVMFPEAATELARQHQVQHVCGSGVALYPECAGDLPVSHITESGSVTGAVSIALVRRAAGQECPTEPLYLRHADVQMPAGRKSVL